MKPRRTARIQPLRRTQSGAATSAARTEPVAGPALDDLRERLDHWSHLWSAEGDAARTEAHHVVSARLSGWLERCFGRHVAGSMRGRESRVSLASSTPIFTAFLGRRATRELSRRVLQDM
jgi:hypothetical protein